MQVEIYPPKPVRLRQWTNWRKVTSDSKTENGGAATTQKGDQQNLAQNPENSEDFSKKPSLFQTISDKRLNDPITLIRAILEPFHKKIGHLATKLNTSAPWQLNTRQQFDVANGDQKDYFDVVRKHFVNTVFLTVNRSTLYKIIDFSFYDYAASNCSTLERITLFGEWYFIFLLFQLEITRIRPSMTKPTFFVFCQVLMGILQFYNETLPLRITLCVCCPGVYTRFLAGHGSGKKLYNSSCQSDPRDLLKPHPLQEAMLKSGIPATPITKGGDVKLTYLHVLRHAFVKATGETFVNGNCFQPRG